MADGEDAKAAAAAQGHLSGFAWRNLKHLKLFDHNLIRMEVRISSSADWDPSVLWQTLSHTQPSED